VPPAPVALGRRRPAPVERKHNTTAAWTMVGVICALKIFTIGLVCVLAASHGHADPHFAVFVVVTQWPWLIPIALVLGVIPFGLWFRLVRARSKRRQLQYAEWNVAC
jgi:drug/metabolite transporter (DMT)-like permease